MANGLQQRGKRMRMRCLQIANTWRTDCNNVADGLPKRGKQIATTWRTDANALLTDCECVANGLQQCNIQKNKNHTFVTQKPPFCTAKTILLHVKNHTFAWRICNIQKTNTLQTFRECILNGLRMRGEYVYAAQ